MKPRTIVGLVLLLVGSLVIGWYAGGRAFTLFEKTVPAGAVTQVVHSVTRGAYVTGGLILGLVIFGFSALAAWGSRFFRSSSSTPAGPPRGEVTATALAPDLLAGKIAWITGGGTGLGRSMALRFAQLGAAVAVSGRRVEPLQAVVAEIVASAGRAAWAPCDVRDAEAVERALESIRASIGLPDILVNNAAGNFLCPSEELSPNGFDAVVRIVLHGTFHCTRAAGRAWIADARPGTVLSIATTYAHTGSGFVLPSACAKAGVVALTRSLAVEWAHHGIRLNAIAPGPIPTEGAFARLLPTKELEATRQRRIPAGRFGTPEELAELAAFLVSDAADWMRGEVVTFDGGEWLRGAGEFNDLLDLPTELLSALRPRKG